MPLQLDHHHHHPGQHEIDEVDHLSSGAVPKVGLVRLLLKSERNTRLIHKYHRVAMMMMMMIMIMMMR